MLRFGSAAPSKKARFSGRERLRLWMLVITLGLVFAAMRHLSQPETVENLDRLFLGQAQPIVVETDDRAQLKSTGPRTSESPPLPAVESSSDLSGVRDNTYFRPEERDAWFDLFARLQAMDPSQLAGASVGEVTYAQLLQQADVYRGQVVTLRGTVLREEVQRPTENTLGIDRYHRLWVRPQGGGQWPFVVYCLKLPADFPRGDQLRADVKVTGCFFKNWSYSFDEGLGLAPVVLARGVDWQPPVAPAPRKSLTPSNLIWAVAGAALFALATVWWAVRRTVRRPRRAGRIPDTFLPGIVVACVLGGSFPVVTAAEQTEDSFQDVLALADLGQEVLAKTSSDGDYNGDDWQLFAQLLYRLRQFPPAQLQQWASAAEPATWNMKPDEHLGQLFAITATVESVEPVAPPENVAAETVLPTLYRCRFRLADGTGGGVVLVPRIPKPWQHREISEEPVHFFGIGLGSAVDNKDTDDSDIENNGRVSLLLTSHLAWYPRQGVSLGRLLLARQGMDIALLDEIKQRRPFVKPDVSREGEAFYQCLAALKAADRQELASLTEQHIAATALTWLIRKPDVEQDHTTLRRKLAAERDFSKRETLQKNLQTVRRTLALAAAVEKQANRKLSSVAPLFLQPEGNVGELVRIEGVARRAVRIAVPASRGSLLEKQSLDAYYEMEVFTADSQNLPVVCCVSRLPAEFPVGDKIREPVRVDGVFFKSWRYRTRKNLAGPGETGRQQRMYTPVVVGGVPTWLPAASDGQNRWGLWGGIVFIAALVVVWIAMICLAKRDRRRRAAMQPARLDDLAGKH